MSRVFPINMSSVEEKLKSCFKLSYCDTVIWNHAFLLNTGLMFSDFYFARVSYLLSMLISK